MKVSLLQESSTTMQRWPFTLPRSLLPCATSRHACQRGGRRSVTAWRGAPHHPRRVGPLALHACGGLLTLKVISGIFLFSVETPLIMSLFEDFCLILIAAFTPSANKPLP